MSETREYRVEYTDSTVAVTVDTYDEAVARVLDRWPGAEYGHDGDISDGGDRTLVWPDEESSIDDGGQNACAEIVQVCGVCGRQCDANPCRHGRD